MIAIQYCVNGGVLEPGASIGWAPVTWPSPLHCGCDEHSGSLALPGCPVQVQGFAARYEQVGDPEGLAATAQFFGLLLQVGQFVGAVCVFQWGDLG